MTALGTTTIATYSISPKKMAIAGTVSGNKLTYTIANDQYTIVNLAGKTKRLIVAADPKQDAPPRPVAKAARSCSESSVTGWARLPACPSRINRELPATTTTRR